MGKIKAAVFLLLAIAAMSVLTACTVGKGSIVILEQPFGGQFDVSLNRWSGQNKCEISLIKGDALQIEITRDSGEISLSIRGKNGSEPYTGNDLESGTFTVTVSETDKYVIEINGKKATGKIMLKRLSE